MRGSIHNLMIIPLSVIILFIDGCSTSDKTDLKNISSMDTLFQRQVLHLNAPDSIFTTHISSEIQMDSKKNYYLSTMNEICKFDSSGKYINSLRRTGEGPGEYKMIRTFCVDDKQNVYIFNAYKPEIIIYDSAFQYLKSIRFKIFYFYIQGIIHKENYLICFMPFGFASDKAIHIIDLTSGQIVKQFGRTDDLAHKYHSLIPGRMHIDKDTIYYVHAHTYKIFKYSVEGNFLGEIQVPEKHFIRISKMRGNLLKTKTDYSILLNVIKMRDKFLTMIIHPSEDPKYRGRVSYDIVTNDGTRLAKNKYFNNPRNLSLFKVNDSTFMFLRKPESEDGLAIEFLQYKY